MAVLWFVVFVQFALIIWLVYDKLKKSPTNRGRGVSSEDD